MAVGGSTIRLGLIGVGRWGSHYVHTIQGTPEAVLARVSTERSDVSALVGRACQVDVSWQSLIDAGDLDGVIIATPPRLHYAIVRYALLRDLPVLAEKPLTMDATEALTLRELALKRGVPMLVDHVYLYHPAYQALRLELGGKPPLRIKGNAGNAGPFRPDTPVLWDYGPHDIAMCLDLMRETPTRVSAQRRDRRRVGNAVGETIRLLLEFASGAIADLSLSNILDQRTRALSVETASERLVFDDAGETKVYREPVEGSGRREAIPFVAKPPLNLVVHEFVEAIKRGTPAERDVELAADVVVTISRCAATLARVDQS